MAPLKSLDLFEFQTPSGSVEV